MDKRDDKTDQISNLMTLSSKRHSVRPDQVPEITLISNQEATNVRYKSRKHGRTLRQECRPDGGRVVLVEIVIDEPEDDRGFSNGRFACEFIWYIMIRVLALFPVLVVVHDERLEQE